MKGFVYLMVVFLTVSANAETNQAPLYRIFLGQGDDLISYGEYVRVDDRVVFSLPLTADLSKGSAQLVSVPADVVDWISTARYADAVRASQHMATLGNVDFIKINAEVALALNKIAFTEDVSKRVALAQKARERLIGWAESNRGYRSDDILQIVALLDEATLSGPDPSARSGISVSLVATTERPGLVPLLPVPTLQEIIARALIVSRLTSVAAERVSILHSVIVLLDAPDSALNADWRKSARAGAVRDLNLEYQIDAAYAELRREALDRAVWYADQADVRGIRSVLDTVLVRDETLGRKRPNHLSAVLATLDSHLADARSLRLERDRWKLQVEVVRQYSDSVKDFRNRFIALSSQLEDIRLLAGPDVSDLLNLNLKFAKVAQSLDQNVPPVEIQPVHDLFQQSLTLAERASRGRHEAVQVGDLSAAWDSAAAAAGALMLFERATEELELAMQQPKLH